MHGELLTDKTSCGIARFPCGSMAFLLSRIYGHMATLLATAWLSYCCFAMSSKHIGANILTQMLIKQCLESVEMQ